MGKVLKVDATAADAWVLTDLVSDFNELEITFKVRFDAAALAFYDTGGCGIILGLFDSLDSFFVDQVSIVNNPPTEWNVNIGGGLSGGTPVAGAWQELKLHHVSGGPSDLRVDGTIIAAGTGDGTFDTRLVRFGQYFGNGADDILYIDTVVIRDAPGGAILFQDDFEDGTLEAWTSTSGDVSVVEDPFPSDDAIITFGRFYEAPPWRFVVSNLEDELLTYLDHLALDRNVTITRAASRVADVRVPSDNPEVNIPAPAPDLDPFLSEGTRILSGFRREGRWLTDDPWVIRFRGLILNLADGADSDHATSVATAYDPWKYLYRRPILLADGSLPGDAGRIYPAGTRPDEIMLDQLQLAIDFGTTIFTDFGQTGFYDGTIEECDPLTDSLTFQKGASLGEMLDTLTALGTCDPVFDPIYDVGARPGILCQLSIYQRAGSFKPNAVFSWDMFPRNVVALSRVTDGTERADQIQFYAGQGGPPVPLETDPAAITKYGDYFAQQFFPGVASIGAVHLLAQRQLALLAAGQLTYTLSPDSGRAPVPFMEYREADTAPLNASRRFRDPISDLRLRIESIPFVIGDDQLERVNQVLVSLETATEE